MRLCRYSHQNQEAVGFYFDDTIVPLAAAAAAFERDRSRSLSLGNSTSLLDYLPPAGPFAAAAAEVGTWLSERKAADIPGALAASQVQLLVPIARPSKLFLLAGNYAAHIEEGGDVARERSETFPYVFMKPPTTTLTHPGAPIRIPKVSPNHIDWELELAIVIGQRCRSVKESEALKYVAGYTIVNDISDRKFKPNPQRKKREKDAFFDWLHGKWHDSFCVCGPCVRSADSLADPQSLPMQLRVNGELKQDASTALMIFSVAAVVEFISSFVTLEPGDIISTGTPAGVGASSGTFLKAGDSIAATIEGIGTLATPVGSEE